MGPILGGMVELCKNGRSDPEPGLQAGLGRGRTLHLVGGPPRGWGPILEFPC